MKKSLMIILAVIVLGAVTATLFLKVRKVEVRAPENFFPEETIIYVSQKGIAGSWEKLKASGFWKELTSSEGWKELEPKIGELQREFEAKWGVPLNEENIMQLAGREVALALLPPEEGDLKPRGLLLAKVGVKVKVGSLLIKLQDELSQAEQLTFEDYRGVEIVRIKTSSPELPQLSYAFLDDWLALEVGSADSILKEVINLYQGQSQKSLARSQNFRKIRSKLPEKRAGLLYVDLERALTAYPEQKMKEILKGKLPGERGQAHLSASFEPFKAAGGASWFDEGLWAKSYLLLNKEKADRELLQMYSSKPTRLRSLSYIPKESVLFAGSTFNINTYWKYLQKALEKQDPEISENLGKGIETFETKWDLNLQNDIFSWMGEEFAYAISELSLEGMFPMPSYFLMIEVKDKTRAKETLTRIKENLKKISQEKKMLFQLKFAVEEYDEEEINFLQVPFLKPGYALVNDFLIISTTTSAIKKVIDTKKGRQDSLSEDANFKRVQSVFTEKSSNLCYLNVEKSLGLVRSIAAWAVSMQEMQLSGIRREKKRINLKEFETEDEREKNLEDCRRRLEEKERKVRNLNENLEGTLYPLLESLKPLKSLGASTITDEKGAKQLFYLAIEEGEMKP